MTTDGRSFSFEFSAPRTEEARAQVTRVYDRLSQLDPHFFSVTYGAGGSTRDGTQETVLDLHARGGMIAPHLSFGGNTFGGNAEAETLALLLKYQQAGITRLVALRGDRPSGVAGNSELVYASELVQFIRKHTGDHFHINVAAYPEIHPESASVETELTHFKRKIDAGADGAITQYFYNAEAYFRFVDACAKRGIQVPIVPGIMPLTNYKGIMRFSELCGADVPRWIKQHLMTYQHDLDALKAFGLEVVTSLCRHLLDGGAPGLHFYTLNQSLPSLRIWKNLGL